MNNYKMNHSVWRSIGIIAMIDPQLYTVGVTDMEFNPTTYVFQRRLKTLDGEHIVNQDYWNQKSEDTNPRYWKNSK